MECHAPVQLSHYSREVETVSWSQDHRIAVTSTEAVYVLTLKGPSSSSSSSSSLPFSISTATVPPGSENPPLTSPETTYDPSSGSMDFSPFLDPLRVPSHTPLGYRESGWSPSGCDVIGGCLLSCLTTGGRLWLLTPPGSHGMQWSVCADISARVDHGMTGGSPCTTFHWLPQVIPAKQGVGGAAVVAMGTRSGHVCVLAMSVPVCPGGRAPELQLLWEGKVVEAREVGQAWPCRLRWSHTHSAGAQLAVGLTSGQLVTLCWQLPATWGGASGNEGGVVLPLPERRVCWGQRDGMAVRHIAWQKTSEPSQQPVLVFSKVSTLVAMQPQATPTPHDVPLHTTIYGIHSRAVSGLTALPSNRYISCSLDSSVQTFQLPLPPHPPSQSHDSQVTPTSVAMETYPALPGHAQRTAHGVAASEHGIFAAVLSNVRATSSSPHQRHKVSSHLHITPALSLALLPTNSISITWDVREAIRMHTIARKPLPSNIQSLLSCPQSSWQQEVSPTTRLCLQFHMKQLVTSDSGDGVSGADASVLGGDVMSGSSDLCGVVMMEHVWRVLEDCEGREWEEGGSESKMSLWLMSQWVESSDLATPTQQHTASKVRSRLQNGMETETCLICRTSIPFTSYCRETCANGHAWERCCNTLLLAYSVLCGRCRGCGAVAHNALSLQLASRGTWFERLVAKRLCTYCNSYFELVT